MMLTVIVLGKKDLNIKEDIEVLYSDGKNLKETITKSKGKYISFINENDQISNDYFKIILKKIKNNYDSIYINYKINYNYTNEIKVLKNENILKSRKPYFGSYIWNYIFKKDKLIKIINFKYDSFNTNVDKLFKNTSSIKEIIYYHNPNKSLVHLFPYRDYINKVHYKNIIYIGEYCNSIFNGYITWIENIGKCFSDKYDITIMYDKITNQSLKKFSKYFKCIKRSEYLNYTCERLIVTYSTFYYPTNIYPLDKNYLFIHGNMDDYSYTVKCEDDLYSMYIAVSKECAKKAIGYYNIDKIDFIYNPFKLDKNIKPHLTLTSAQRSADVKKTDRIEKIAQILDEEQIPYTWNLFTDSNEGHNKNGLIYRHRTTNPYPYIKDCDYFVLLSDSEACPYALIEALSLNTKVIVTPLKVFKELGVNDENSFTIPFEYFEEKNKEKLRDTIKKIYKEKEKTFTYKYDESLYKDYNQIFK